ncbi:MAG: thiamine-phosphate kinase [Candidatus Dormibacter sp.]
MPEPAPIQPDRRFGSGGPTLAAVGEVALIDQLVAIAGSHSRPIAGFPAGDDAALWHPPSGCDVAVSIDALVEDVDFRRGWITPRQLGRRAFAVAVSDLAGTGAEPIHCLATLCARRTEQVEDVLEIQRGLCEAAAAAGCAVAGGDVSAIDGPLVIDVSVTGIVPAGHALRRSAGRPGDVLIVTGVLGRAAAGLRLLLDDDHGASSTEQRWVESQLQPATRLREGRRLLAGGVRCGGDVSDGLVIDALRTARASGCAVELWADYLPVDPALVERFGKKWLELAIGGGEDFELFAAVAETEVEALLRDWPGELAPLTTVGAFCRGEGVRLLDGPEGTELPLPPTHAGHFS